MRGVGVRPWVCVLALCVFFGGVCVRVCVRARAVCACVRARVSVCACVRVCARARVRAGGLVGGCAGVQVGGWAGGWVGEWVRQQACQSDRAQIWDTAPLYSEYISSNRCAFSQQHPAGLRLVCTFLLRPRQHQQTSCRQSKASRLGPSVRRPCICK